MLAVAEVRNKHRKITLTRRPASTFSPIPRAREQVRAARCKFVSAVSHLHGPGALGLHLGAGLIIRLMHPLNDFRAGVCGVVTRLQWAMSKGLRRNGGQYAPYGDLMSCGQSPTDLIRTHTMA